MVFLNVFANRKGKMTTPENGPWKYQIIDRLDRAIALLERLTNLGETREKKAVAGRKSAQVRREKFGSAVPTRVAQSVQFAEVEIKIPAETDCVREQKTKKRKGVREQKTLTDGSLVWNAYELAFQKRWNVVPLRNARNNRHCADLVKQVGAQYAIELAQYYLTRSDAFYVNAKHPIGLLILNANKLHTEMKTKTVTTMVDARRIESHSRIDQVLQEYAEQQDLLTEVESAAP